MLHRPPKCRRLLLVACLVARLAHAADLQDISQLEKVAGAEAQRLLPPLTDKQRLVVGPVQPRLQLPRCEDTIRTARAPGIQVPGRVLIELRCDGHAPVRTGPAFVGGFVTAAIATPCCFVTLRASRRPTWRKFSAQVKTVGTTPVVLAAHALVVGTVLTPKDVTVEQRDIVGLPPGYLDDAGIALGLTAARAIAGGAILTNQQLLGAQAVQRGQMVTLLADAGGISVRMAGRALSDGLK